MEHLLAWPGGLWFGLLPASMAGYLVGLLWLGLGGAEARISVDGDRWRARMGGGPLILCGLPFLVAGGLVLFVLLSSMRPDPAAPAPRPLAWLRLLFLVLPGVFIWVGGEMIFWRMRVTIDRAKREVEVRRGLLCFMRRRVQRLEAFERVQLVRRWSSGPFAGGTDVHLSLQGPDRAVVVAAEFKNQERAREAGERLAAFCGLPFRDAEET